MLEAMSTRVARPLMSTTRARPARRVALRRGLAIVLAALVVVAGLVLGLRVAGPTTRSTALGDVRLVIEPSLHGVVDAYVPIADWGVRIDAFRGPFRVRAEPRSIDRSAVLRAAAGERALLDRAVRDVDEAAAAAIRRAVLFAIAGAALLAVLGVLAAVALSGLSGRRAAAIGAAMVLVAAVVAIGAALSARSTFDPDAIERPRFYARGDELSQLLASASKAEATATKYRSKVEGSLQRFSGLLAEGRIGTETFADAGGERRALLGSDLHANRFVVEPLRSLADRDEPIFLVGDFGHEGNEGEARVIAPALARLGARAVAVSGNHDSSALMRHLARAGITVLTAGGRLRGDGSVAPGGPVIDVDGLRVAGFPDPLEWRGRNPQDPERQLGFAQMPDGDEARRRAADALVRWFDGLRERPDVVLVHQNGLAQQLARTLHERDDGRSLVILTGHDHQQHVDRHGAVVVVDAGSVGAGGLLGIADERVGVGELRFAPDAPTLRSVDLIEVEPFGGAGQAERVVAGRRCEDPEEACTLSR
jgi:predicted phosphodiesterase